MNKTKRGRPKLYTGKVKERRCSVCRHVLPASMFYSAKRSGGITYVCRECSSLVVRKAQMRRRLEQKGEVAFRENIALKEAVLQTARDVLAEWQASE